MKAVEVRVEDRTLRLTNLDRVLRAHPSVVDASRDW